MSVMTESGFYSLEAIKDGSIWDGEMTYSEWEAKYKPIPNHITKYNQLQFETYGDEVEYVKSVDPKRVWTWVDGDACSLLLAGWHYVNRLSYYVCEKPWETGDEQVLLSVEVECECYDEEAYGPYTLPNGHEYWESGNPECKLCEGQGIRTEYLD